MRLTISTTTEMVEQEMCKVVDIDTGKTVIAHRTPMECAIWLDGYNYAKLVTEREWTEQELKQSCQASQKSGS